MSAAALAVSNHHSPPRPSTADHRAVNSSPTRPRPRNMAGDSPAAAARSPHSSRSSSHEEKKDTANAAPRPPVIKQERANSTEPPAQTAASSPPPSRHRPRRLDLSNDRSRIASAQPSAPLTGSIQDVGIACLSPGFQTQDPAMRQQLQRSMDMRDQQRRIIEQRQHQKDGSAAAMVEPAMPSSTFARPPGTSKRKGPPANLNLQSSTYSRFADERVVQSAPLHQSFTGLNRGGPHPLSRQILDRTNSDRSDRSHANTNSNRLPPIGDMFASQDAAAGAHQPRRPSETLSRQNSGQHGLAPPRSPAFYPPQASPGYAHAPQRSPGLHPPRTSPPHPPSLAPPAHGRSRDFNSAEEAMRSLSGGREDLMPKIVHYGGHQPPTPPSPLAPGQHSTHLRPDEQPRRHSHTAYEPSVSRRRSREEYERDYPNQRFGFDEERARQNRDGPFGAGRDSPETQRRKKEEFMSLCARAWDLFHS